MPGRDPQRYFAEVSESDLDAGGSGPSGAGAYLRRTPLPPQLIALFHSRGVVVARDPVMLFSARQSRDWPYYIAAMQLFGADRAVGGVSGRVPVAARAIDRPYRRTFASGKSDNATLGNAFNQSLARRGPLSIHGDVVPCPHSELRHRRRNRAVQRRRHDLEPGCFRDRGSRSGARTCPRPRGSARVTA